MRYERHLETARYLGTEGELVNWLARAIVGSDPSISAAMLLDQRGRFLSSSRAGWLEADMSEGSPMLVRLPKLGLEAFVRVDSEQDRVRVRRKISSLGDFATVIPR